MTNHTSIKLIEEVIDNNYEKILQNCLGLWVNCLWIRYEELSSLDEYREAFFLLLQRLLDEGRVRFIKPNIDIYFVAGGPPPSLSIEDEENHWIADANSVLQNLRKRWPECAKDFDDDSINLFFFETPPLIWKGEDGVWRGS
ncbi:hypothetical protein [Maritimibacter sp. 55A14]|uniref:hypothetical protein n=1 Tax=Maritimibacter sp. 55A14 TaxID=2174844 RepID=UPI0011B1D910|nr:hypothetical protein [Maritimibacter sp. 55A14]